MCRVLVAATGADIEDIGHGKITNYFLLCKKNGSFFEKIII